MNANQRPSQGARILERLQAARAASSYTWVSMPTLASYSGAYAVHSRVAELRKRGHRIENEVRPMADGTRMSWYRLTPEEATP